jgi:hypothetical protein
MEKPTPYLHVARRCETSPKSNSESIREQAANGRGRGVSTRSPRDAKNLSARGKFLCQKNAW